MSADSPIILVVDDSPTQLQFICLLLEKEGYSTITAENGQLGLEAIRRPPSGLGPSLVITDLNMPVMDGLQLVEAASKEFPDLPVVLTTAQGSEEIASQALRAGAASYVPKKFLAADLGETLERILAVRRAEQKDSRLAERMTSQEVEFTLDHEDSLFPELIALLQENMRQMALGDENVLVQVATALDEALVNALYHGNLEVSSDLREVDGGRAFAKLANERRQCAPYRDRQLMIRARINRQEAVFWIRDQGPGFDPKSIPDPRDPENLDKVSGRGLLLINYFMDDVSHNDQGNEITMIKRKVHQND